MNVLIIGEPSLASLADLNASGPSFQKLEPALLTDGRRVLNADLLADSGPGGTWHHYADLLASLPIEAVALEQFAPTEI
jgi:hypothetical protein